MKINNENIYNTKSLITCRRSKKYKPQGFYYNDTLYVLNENKQYVLANNMFCGNIQNEGSHYLYFINEVSRLIYNE